MTPEQIQDYLTRSGDGEILSQYPSIVNDHGFMSYMVEKDIFIIIQCYGDGKYWNKKADELAKSLELNEIMFSTGRNPATFERKYGYKIVGHILKRGVK